MIIFKSIEQLKKLHNLDKLEEVSFEKMNEIILNDQNTKSDFYTIKDQYNKINIYFVNKYNKNINDSFKIKSNIKLYIKQSNHLIDKKDLYNQTSNLYIPFLSNIKEKTDSCNPKIKFVIQGQVAILEKNDYIKRLK